ncbi:hypothetical protein Trydic_g16479 [Trypoxylus dichotomus]
MHWSGIPRRRQSFRQGLGPGPTPEDAPCWQLQSNGQAHSLLSPQEDLQSQAGRTAVHSEDGHSRRAARVSDQGAAHIHRVLDRGHQMLATLYPMMAGRGKLDPSLKVRIYKTVLRPTITYASAMWATAVPTHIKTLEAFHNRTLRRALNAPWYVRNTVIQEDTGVGPLMD